MTRAWEGRPSSKLRRRKRDVPAADPRKSTYCAIRHLLRNLSDSSALLRNPLAIELIGSQRDASYVARALRERVDEAIAAMDRQSDAVSRRRRSRHGAIIMRCDVLRQPRSVVAGDLGLSISQFESERRIAMSRFTRALLSSRSLRPSVAVNSSLPALVLEKANQLADAGDQASARAMLDDLARNGHEDDRILALISMANLETSSHEPERASTLLADTKGLLDRRDDVDAGGSALARAWEAAGLRLSLVAGGLHNSIERAREPFLGSVDRHGFTLLIARAETLLAFGDIDTCRQVVKAARSVASRLDDLDAGARIDLLSLEPQVRYWASGCRSNDEVRDFEHAESEATAAGYDGRAAFLRLMCLSYRWKISRDFRDRREFRSEYGKCARLAGLAKNLRYLMFHVCADVESALGDPWRAAEAARRALELGLNRCDAAYMKSLLCEAYARGGRRSVARDAAMEIMDRSGSAPWGALLNASRTLSRVSFADGKAREGRKYLADSLHLARQFAPPGLQTVLLSQASRLFPGF